MSIIQEALRKAESRTPKEGVAAKAPALENQGTQADLPLDPARHPPAATASHSRKLGPVYLALLAALFAITVSYLFTHPLDVGRRHPPQKKVESSAASAVPKEDAPRIPNPEIMQPLSNSVKELLLPTSTQIQAPVKKATETQFAVSGIMYLEGNPQAIINGRVVREGDVIDGATVVRINRGDVVIRVNGSELTLQLI